MCSGWVRTHRAVQMKVTAGRRLEGRIEILDGLAQDAQVVTAGAGFLSDGDLVRYENPARLKLQIRRKK